MKAAQPKRKGEGRKALPFFVRVCGELIDYRKLRVEHMHAMSDVEWRDFRAAQQRRSQEGHATVARTRAQNGILEAMYYRELAKWKRGPQTKRPPEKPSAQRLPSRKQVTFLAALLNLEEATAPGQQGYKGLISYVEFANRIPRSYGYHPRLAPNGTLLLNRQHWASAITLAKDGRNTHGSEVRMVKEDCGIIDTTEQEALQLVDRGWVFLPSGRVVYQPVLDLQGPSAPGGHGDVDHSHKAPSKERERSKYGGGIDMGIRSMEELERAISNRDRE